MAAPVGYRKYKDDTEKAKVYNHRLAVAEMDFENWSGQAKDWWDRYENVPKQTQATPKGLLVNVTTGVAVIDALFSGLTAIDVEFALSPQGRTSLAQAQLAELALNEEWVAGHVDDERDDAIKDALVDGIGWMKVSYDFYAERQEVARDPDAIRAEVEQLIADARDAGLEPPDPKVIGQLVPDNETIDIALRDGIAVDYVPWDCVRWDPSARRWRDVRWVAQLTKLPLVEVQQNPLWREYAKRTRHGLQRLDKVSADSSIDTSLLANGRATTDDERVTVVEMWDLESGTVCTFVKGQTWLLYESVNPFALHASFDRRSPFVPLVLRKTTRRVRGIGDMEVMTRSLNEKNLYRSRTATYLERFVPKLVGPEDALTEEGKVQLASSEYGAYVSTQAGIDPKALLPLSPPALPAEAFNMGDRIDDEIREATGVNELMRGLFPDRKRTATETEEVVSASAARQSEKRNTLERFHNEVARRMLELMMQFYDQERMVRYGDDSMADTQWSFTGADILGDFTVSVSLEPREAPTRDSQRQEATVALNVLGPLAMPGQDGSSIIDRATLARWFMRKYGFAPRDINELLNDQASQQMQTEQTLAFQQASAAAGQGAAALQTDALPPDVVAGAVGGTGPGAPQAAEELSRSAGVRA